MSSVPLLCISASFNRPPAISEVLGKSMFPEHHLCGGNPETELAEAKNSGRPIVLIVLGPMGHEGIKYLCDDYEKPKEERRVKWVHSISAGIDWYRLELLQKEMQGIPFTNTKGGYNLPLAMHSVYSILYFQRETVKLQENRKEHRWDPFDTQDPRGCKVGILGYGEVGRTVAKMLQPMGMVVTGVKRSSKPDEVDEYGASVVSGDQATEQVIRESDFLVNILPGTAGTANFFNAQTFLKMKPTAIYINIGRGSTQNEDDLATALRNNVIAGASLDVFKQEPLQKDSPLWDIPDNKVLMTSHNACITKNSFRDVVSMFVPLAREFLKGGEIAGYHPDIVKGY